MNDCTIRGFNLSQLQKRGWLLQTTTSLYQRATAELEGVLDESRLVDAIRAVVARHDSLRTVYHPKPDVRFPLQVVGTEPTFAYTYFDASGTSGDVLAATFPVVPLPVLSPSEAPLRVDLMKLNDHRHQLVLTLPTLSGDARSLQNIIREISSYYADGSANLSNELIQYPQFAQWQSNLLSNPEPEAVDFWEKYGNPSGGQSRLPFEEKEAIGGVSGQDTVCITLPASVVASVKALAQSQHVDVSTVVLACLYLLTYKHNRQERITIGLVNNERAYEELEATVGLLSKVLPLTLAIDPNENALTLLEQIRNTVENVQTWDDYYTGGYTFDGGTDNADLPTFSLGFEWFDLGQPLSLNRELTLSVQSIQSHTDRFRLKVSGLLDESGIQLHFGYQSAYFSSANIARLAEQFIQLVQDMVAHPGGPMRQLSALNATDARRIEQLFQAPQTMLPAEATVLTLFEEKARQMPEQTAIVFNNQSLTYQALDEKANRLAHYLIREHQIAAGDRVLIQLPRSEKLVVTILAVLKTGAAYLPVDNQLPAERVRFIAEDSQSRLHIAGQIDEMLVLAENYAPHKPQVSIDTEAPAYVIYTSGSTGKPKGVLIAHRSLANYLCWFTTKYPVGAEDRTLLFSSLAFDLSYTSFWSCLVSGATLYMLDEQPYLDPKAFIAALLEHRITYIKLTPSHFSLIVKDTEFDQLATRYALRMIVLGGEEINTGDVATYWQYAPDTQFVNHYGPTEATIGTIAGTIDRQQFAQFRIQPVLGRPITNNQIYILNDGGNQSAIGEIGELCVSGCGLAIGYLNRPELTAEKFIEHPYRPGERLYRTGDLGRWLANGTIEFLGRKDFQVKIRGFRVEPGEIDAVLLQHTDVKQALTIARTDQQGLNYLVAYLIVAPGADRRDWAGYLAQFLPEYMVPAYCLVLDALPLTANGKVDRNALPDPTQAVISTDYIAPSHAVEQQLATIWEEVLERKPISVTANFFALGGHSLKAVQIVSRVYKEMQAKIEFKSIFEAPTIQSLAALIAQTAPAQAYETITPIPDAEFYKASHGQKRLWVLSQLGEGTAYNTFYAYRLNGPLNVAAFRDALTALVDRHQILRTTFTLIEGEPWQQIHPSGTLDFWEEISVREVGNQAEYVRELAAREAAFVFDLQRGSLFRAKLVQLSHQQHLFFLNIHHCLSDGWSLRVIINEIMSLYDAFRRGQPSPFPALSIQYRDYAHWQSQQLTGELARRHQAYWQEQLAGPLPVLELPTYRSRPPIQTDRGQTVRLTLPENLRNELLQLSQQQGSSLFMTLVAALNVLFYKYTNQNDIILGTSVAGRDHQALENQIGLYLNTVALRTRFETDSSFSTLLSHVRETVLAAFDHAQYPFDRLVDELPLQRDLSRSPLFDVLVEMQNYEHNVAQTEGVYGLTDIDALPYEVATETSIFDLNLMFIDAVSALQVHIRYNTDLFAEEQIVALGCHFEQLLSQIVENPDESLAHLNVLTGADLSQLDAFNQTDIEFPQQPAFRLFEENAVRYATRLAVQDGQQTRTYRELNERANQLARFITRTTSIGPNDLVAIRMERSVRWAESILAVWKCGAAYLPIDAAYPQERIQYMMTNSRAKLVLTDTDEFVETEAPIINLTEVADRVDQESTANPDRPVGLRDLAYVIYTSGSTGFPKGAMVEQLGMVNHLFSKVNSLTLTQTDCLVQNASACFDISVWQLWAALLVGGQTRIYSDQLVLNPEQLINRVEFDQVTVLEVVPSYLSVLLDYLDQPVQPALFTHLRYLVVTGEALVPGLAKRWFERFPSIPLVNAYGPTEASDDITHHIIRQTPDGMTVPVGKPVQNLKIYVVDPHMNRCPVSVKGEICVSGIGVGQGYLYDPQKTAAAFTTDPFRAEAGVRLYKTGDIGRFLPDGCIEFLGRKDNQVKIRGHRIELAEIEHALTSLYPVKEAVVLAVDSSSEHAYLCAYLTCFDGHTVESAQLRAELAQRLPEYMIPSVMLVLPTMPLNANGKIDRKALPTPVLPSAEETFCAPRTPIETALLSIWQEVLRKETISVRDNFFEIGGHSLRATRVMTLIEKNLGLQIGLRDLFVNPTIEQLAERLTALQVPIEQARIMPIPEQDHYELSHAQQRLWVMNQFESQRIAYNVPAAYVLTGPLQREAFAKAFDALLERHESLRTTIITVAGQPRQRIHSRADYGFRMDYLDLRLASDRDEQTRHLAEEEALTPFDLANGPLIRARLIQLDDNRYVFLFTLHHIISDGWSEAVLVNDVLVLYDAFVHGKPVPLEPLRIQYKDFAAWQNRQLSGDQLMAHQNYWLDQFQGPLTPLALHTDFPRSDVQTTEANRVFFTLSPDLKRGLQQMGQTSGTTLFMTLLATLKVLLYRQTLQTDIVVGTPTAGREQAELSGQIGLYLNMLALRTQIDPSIRFADLLERVKETMLGAFAHQVYPFDQLVDALNLPRDGSRNPLFDVGFTWQNLDDVEENGRVGAFDAIEVSYYQNGFNQVKADFWFHGWEAGDQIGLSITYNKALYRPATIDQLINRFNKLVSALVGQPSLMIEDLLTSLAETEKSEAAMNQTKTKEKNLEKFFATKTKKRAVDNDSFVSESFMEGNPGYPLVIRPTVANIILADWLRNHQKLVNDKLLQTGAILFRGFALMSAEEAQHFAGAMGQERLSYVDQSSPRSLVADKLYTSTDHPADQVINMHNELSYSHQWPMQIAFFCLQAAESGGETPIADSRRTLHYLSEKTQAKFGQKGIRYVRNLIEGMGLSWQEVYQTSDRAEVESYCNRNGVEYEWKNDRHLKISWNRPAIQPHPVTNEKVWFNHGFFFNAQTLDPTLRALATTDEMLPFNTYYGDGTPIEPEVIDEIRLAFDRAKCVFTWQKGDVLLLDNMLMAHGRHPFGGQRKVLVAMNDAYSPYESAGKVKLEMAL